MIDPGPEDPAHHAAVAAAVPAGARVTAILVTHAHRDHILLPTLGKMPVLSNREAEVLSWAARGKSNAAIGEILGISAHTVDAHLRRVYLKLGVFDRLSAAVRGLGFGLIAIDG